MRSPLGLLRFPSSSKVPKKIAAALEADHAVLLQRERGIIGQITFTFSLSFLISLTCSCQINKSHNLNACLDVCIFTALFEEVVSEMLP